MNTALAGEWLDRQFRLEWLLVWILWAGLAVLAYSNTHTSTAAIYPEPSNSAVAAAQTVTGAAALGNVALRSSPRRHVR